MVLRHLPCIKMWYNEGTTPLATTSAFQEKSLCPTSQYYPIFLVAQWNKRVKPRRVFSLALVPHHQAPVVLIAKNTPPRFTAHIRVHQRRCLRVDEPFVCCCGCDASAVLTQYVSAKPLQNPFPSWSLLVLSGPALHENCCASLAKRSHGMRNEM